MCMDDIQFVYTFLILDFLAERLLAALSLSMLLSSENATREAVCVLFPKGIHLEGRGKRNPKHYHSISCCPLSSCHVNTQNITLHIAYNPAYCIYNYTHCHQLTGLQCLVMSTDPVTFNLQISFKPLITPQKA